MALRPANILGLCAGTGGLELGIRLACPEARAVCYVEREAAAAASLVASMEAGWFHQAPVWADLLTFDARRWRGLVHILASGDPCQDNSVAGNQAGAEGERFLAPEVVRIADECRPDLIFRENVPGNAAEQLAALQPPLERMGYRVAAGIFSSAETGNTMRRERLFIMAERDGSRLHWSPQLDSEPEQSEQRAFGRGHALRCGQEMALSGHDEPSGRDQPSTDHVGRDGAGLSSGREPAPRGRELARPEMQRPGEEGQDFGRPEERPGRSGRKLGDSEIIGCGTRRTEQSGQRGQAGVTVANLPMGGAYGSHSQGQRSDSGKVGREDQGRPTRLSGRAILPPAVIPGPTDSRWIDVLEQWPEFQPALSQEEAESHLRRGIDALAHRVERLRATGNGVDPVAAAYAFLRLRARLAEASGSTGIVLMERAA